MSDYINGGYFKSEGRWRHPERIIDSNEIIYVTKGEVHITEENTEYHVKAGEILVLEKNKLHYGTEHSSDTEFYWIHFNSECDFKYVSGVGDNLKILMRQLLHYENTPTYPEEIIDLMLKIMFLEIKVSEGQTKDGISTVAAEVKEWIRVNSDKRLSVSEVSEKFGYNPDYLCRIFKNGYGISLKKYIEAQHLAYLKSLIVSTAYNMSEIAEMAGFESYQTFLKYFTYHEKISPMKFRNAYFNTHINKK